MTYPDELPEIPDADELDELPDDLGIEDPDAEDDEWGGDGDLDFEDPDDEDFD